MNYLDYNLVGLLERPQLLRYTSPSRGYNWHIDLGQGEASTRKISISMLNEDFVGGELLFSLMNYINLNYLWVNV